MTRIKVLSLFSGAGGLDLGLERAGMEVVALCEIDPKARMVLRKHWPDTYIYNDVREVTRERLITDNIERPDIVAGGSPCQDLSVAGRRKGLDGSRSGLFWEQCRIADEIGADIFWENVPGALSSNNGADFAAVLWGITGALVELPPKQKWAKSGVLVGPKRTAIWRIADAQRFGVPQRRRRIYVVGCSGAVARGLAPLLLERQSGQGNHQTSRETGTRASGASQDRSDDAGSDRAGRTDGDTRSWVKSKRASSDKDDDSWKEQPVSPTLNAFDNGGDSRATVLTVHNGEIPFTQTKFAQYGEGVGTLRANGGDIGGGSETLILGYTMTTGKANVDTITAGIGKGPRGTDAVGSGQLVIIEPIIEVAACLRSGGDGGVPSSRGENLVVQEEPFKAIGFSHTQGLDHQASTSAFPTLRAEGGGHAIMYDTNETPVLFQQNQRDEVRIMPGYAGSLNAENGMHNTNFVVQDQE